MNNSKKISIKCMADKLKNLSNDIIISGHKNADYDSLCSSLALAYSLKKMNKNVKVFIEPENIKKIDYFNLSDLLCKKIETKDYTFIAMDLNKTSRLPASANEYYKKANYRINIDHHNGNTTKAEIILSNQNTSSTCEITYDIIKKLNIDFDKKLSELIFTGIISDTNLFFNNTSSKTFSIASKLLKNGIESEALIKKFYLEKTKNEMNIISYINNNMTYCNFHYAILDMKKEPFNLVSYSDISKKCIPVVLNREDIDVMMVIMDYGNKRKGEIRSKNKLDVSKLAELLIGGGHTHAAGFSNNKTIDEIINISKKYITDNNNGK